MHPDETIDTLEARIAELEDAIRYFFTPLPGSAMPVRYRDATEPCHKSWNEKLDRLRLALGDDITLDEV